MATTRRNPNIDKHIDNIFEDFKLKFSIADDRSKELDSLRKTHTAKIKKTLSVRKAKDPNAPKKPLTAYILFSKDEQKILRKKNPTFKVPELTKEVATNWKNANKKVKDKYAKLAEADKLRYQQELENYTPAASTTAAADEESAPAEPRPKRKPTNYMNFCAAKRAEVKASNPNLNPKQTMSELGRLWKALSDADKASYATQSATEEDEE